MSQNRDNLSSSSSTSAQRPQPDLNFAVTEERKAELGRLLMNLGRRAHKINDMHEDDPLRAEMIRRMKDQVRLIVRDVIHHDKSATLFNFFFAAFQEHREVLVQRAVLFNSITTRLAETGHRDLVDRFLYLMPLRRQRMIKDEKILIWDPVKGWEDHGMYYWPQLPEFEFLSKWME